MNDRIEYTCSEVFPVAELRGRRLTDGTLVEVDGAGKPRWFTVAGMERYRRGNAVRFAVEGIDKAVMIKLSGRPILVKAVQTALEANLAAIRAGQAAEQERLEKAVPGATAIMQLWREYMADQERYSAEFEAMMDDERNDGVRPPRPEDRSLGERLARMRQENPRAALYLKAWRQAESAHWGDNTGAGEAARRAMELLEDGASIEVAEVALSVRRNTDWD